jgi:hypothetical protein
VSESLDDLAAFLMHRTNDEKLSEAERLEIYAVVGAYQEGYELAQVEPLLRNAGAAFADHPDYQADCRPADTAGADAAPEDDSPEA